MHWPTLHRYLEVSFAPYFDAVSPAAAISGETLLTGLGVTAYVVVIASFVAARIKQTWLRVPLFFVAALAAVGGSWMLPGACGNIACYRSRGVAGSAECVLPPQWLCRRARAGVALCLALGSLAGELPRPDRPKRRICGQPLSKATGKARHRRLASTNCFLSPPGLESHCPSCRLAEGAGPP